MGMMKCPACPVQLQPLDPSTSYVADAMQHAQALGVEVPTHGPAALVFCALVSHAMLLHDDLDLVEFLEAYLNG